MGSEKSQLRDAKDIENPKKQGKGNQRNREDKRGGLLGFELQCYVGNPILQQLATQETMAEMLNDQLNYIESEMRRQTENGEQFLNRLSRENENLQSDLRQQAGKRSESNSTWRATTEAWLAKMRLQWILFLLPWVLNTILLFLLWLSLR